MAEASRFFNAVDGDRVYSAADWAEYFASFIGNGVFGSPSTNLQVSPGDGMNVSVAAGLAWINGYFYTNDAALAQGERENPGGISRARRGGVHPQRLLHRPRGVFIGACKRRESLRRLVGD